MQVDNDGDNPMLEAFRELRRLADEGDPEAAKSCKELVDYALEGLAVTERANSEEGKKALAFVTKMLRRSKNMDANRTWLLEGLEAKKFEAAQIAFRIFDDVIDECQKNWNKPSFSATRNAIITRWVRAQLKRGGPRFLRWRVRELDKGFIPVSETRTK